MKNANPEIKWSVTVYGLRKILAISLLVLLCSGSSCRKEAEPEYLVNPGEKVEASGTVVDAFSGKPIPYAEIILTKNQTSLGWGAKTVDSKLSDSTGKFSFFFIPEENFKYKFYINKHHYVSGFNTTLSVTKHNRNMRVALTPYGYIRMHVPKFTEKEASFIIYGGFKPNLTFNPPFKDTSYIVSEVGNAMTLVWVAVDFPNGSRYDIRDSIFMPALDTVDYFVKF